MSSLFKFIILKEYMDTILSELNNYNFVFRSDKIEWAKGNKTVISDFLHAYCVSKKGKEQVSQFLDSFGKSGVDFLQIEEGTKVIFKNVLMVICAKKEDQFHVCYFADKQFSRAATSFAAASSVATLLSPLLFIGRTKSVAIVMATLAGMFGTIIYMDEKPEEMETFIKSALLERLKEQISFANC